MDNRFKPAVKIEGGHALVGRESTGGILENLARRFTPNRYGLYKESVKFLENIWKFVRTRSVKIIAPRVRDATRELGRGIVSLFAEKTDRGPSISNTKPPEFLRALLSPR